MPYSFDPQVRDAIVRIARNHGVDPVAALAVAMGEGGIRFGAVGDNNTSWGPFQLHRGGALPADKDAAWANSIPGIRYAIRTMANAGAKGLEGLDAINAIVRQFERPAAPDASVQNAWKRYQDPAFRQTLMDAVGPLPGQQPQMPGTQPQGAPTNDLARAAALASMQRIAAGEKADPVRALSDLIVERQKTASTPSTQPGTTRPQIESNPARAGEQVTLPSGLVQPIAGKVPTTSAFGYVDPEGMPDKNGVKRHGAVDWFGKAGTGVRTPWAGEVVEVKASRGNTGQVFGGVVKVRDPITGYVFVVRHIDPAKFKVGQEIDAGTVIGGITDWKSGSPHAHIEIWRTLEGGYRHENAIDPVTLFGQ